MSTPNPFPFSFPVVITEQGLQPQSPVALNQQLIAAVTAQQPGYTANLPGSLVEDISSTCTGAIVLCDSAKVETVNSLTPWGANVFVLTQLGQCLGLSLGSVTNTSVFVVFAGTVGYVISNGFLVSDGTNVYQIPQGGPIASTGYSSPLYAVAVAAGSFAVPANTVTQLLTSVPAAYTVTVNNPNAGTPGGPGETYYSYRSRVLTAMLAACVGASRFIKTLIGQLLGAQSNLISVQQASGGLRIVVGGSADPYNIAYAIWQSVGDPSVLQGSAINSGRNVTVSLIDYPDTYPILYVMAPVQTVTMAVTWNTTATSFTGGGAFPGLTQAPLAAYVNALGVGQPINVLEMNEIFQQAVEPLLDASLLTRLVFSVSINGTPVSPGAGTYAITGDAESSFTCAASGISVAQG